MIRGIFPLLLIFCLALPAPAGAVWLFGGQKKEKTTTAPAPQKAPPPPPTIYIAPQEGEEVQVMDKLLNRPESQSLSPLFSGKLFEKLTPEMMSVAYAPKTQEEFGMIAVASKIQQISTVTDMRKASRERMAAAKKKTDEALQAMRQQAEKEKAAALLKAQAADNPAAAMPAKAKPVKKVMPGKSDTLKKPSKVFKDF